MTGPSIGREERLVSYAQNAEDVRLWRVFSRVDRGFYVDVGAAGPTVGSVTHLFYERGWSGINIEPGPLFGELDEARPRDTNLQIAVSRRQGPISFFLTYPDLGMSTLDPATHSAVPDAVERVEQIEVISRSLESVLAEHAQDRVIHFLKVDAEGAEHEVLASSDWTKFRPVVVVVESISSWGRAQVHEEWEPILKEAGYEFAVFDGINRFYVEPSHSALIEAISYPISALDRYATSDEVDAEHRAKASERQIARLSEEIEQLASALGSLESEASHLRRELDHTTDQLALTQDALDLVYRSRTWQAGRMVAAVGRPFRGFRRGSSRSAGRPFRQLAPGEAYAAATSEGAAWYFPLGTDQPRGSWPEPADRLLELFGDPTVALDEVRAKAVVAVVAEGRWSDEQSLLAKRLMAEERRAVIEADAVARLVLAGPDGVLAEAELDRAPRSIVADARCLQHVAYRTRGVGLHGRTVLNAVRQALPGWRLALLTDAELPPLDVDVVSLADEVLATSWPFRSRAAGLFLELSPMTAGCGSATPFLSTPGCRTAAVVHDFIPTRFPAAYLGSSLAALTNRIRIEALRHYDLLLANSSATREECERILGAHVSSAVTGVADPIEDVEPSVDNGSGPFVLIPTGGDARKDAPAALAALAIDSRSRGEHTRAVITGAITGRQEAGLREMVRSIGLPEGEVEIRGYVRPRELARLYAEAEIVVVPSLAEGFSIPVVEAVHRGAPVVASDISVHRELLGPGPWLAPSGDVDALAGALAEVRRNRDEASRRQRETLAGRAMGADVRGRAGRAVTELVRRGSFGQRSPVPRKRGGAPPRLAVMSPLPPQQSGVATYTAYTFEAVKRYADVDFYSPEPDVNDTSGAQPLSSAPYLDRRFDAVVNVVGNSHFHFPILDLLEAFGGATISHDNRMLEAYNYDRGPGWTAALISREGRRVSSGDLEVMIVDLNRATSTGNRVLAEQSSPLIVHGPLLAQRIFEETGIEPAVVPFVPYNIPDAGQTNPASRRSARLQLGLEAGILHIGTFGIVDRRTKGVDTVIGALSWLRSWGRSCHLHVVGGMPEIEREALEVLAAGLNVSEAVTLHGRVPSARLERFLLGVDVAVQLRTSALLSLSGALADCIAFGVPTVTTRDLAIEMEVPAYVESTSGLSSLLVAEAIEALLGRDLEVDEVERARRSYLGERSADAYARRLLAVLGLQ